MSIDSYPELNSLLQAALNEFENRAGTNLVQHQVFNTLRTCQSVDSVLDVLHEQSQAFRHFRGNDGKLMMWIKRTVEILHSLSTSGVLGEGVGLVITATGTLAFYSIITFFLQAFPPAKAVFAGIAILLSVYFLPRFARPDPHQSVTTIRQSRISTRPTMFLSIFLNPLSHSSSDLKFILKFRPRWR